MMSTEILSPVTTPGMIYPEFGKFRPKRKYYKCPRCNGNVRTTLSRQIVRKEEIVFGFKCYDCGRNWFVSSKLMLNDVLEEQILRIANFTKQTGKEFGALVVTTPDGIRLDMVEIGENLEVTFKQTHELREGEQVVGTWHAHPLSDEFSDWDIGSFLHDDFEKISIVSGARGTINVMVKTSETVKIDDIKKWVKENEELSLKEKGNLYKFLVFKGKANNLQLMAGVTDSPTTTLEKLLKQIK